MNITTNKAEEAQWDEFFTMWENDPAGGPTVDLLQPSGEAGHKRPRLDPTLKSMVHLKQGGKPAGMLNMAHKWNEIPDDELYQMNAQEIVDLDSAIKEFEEDATNSFKAQQSKNASEVESEPKIFTPDRVRTEVEVNAVVHLDSAEEDNIILVPESKLDATVNPYSKEFYNSGSIVINKLRLKKLFAPDNGWLIFLKKENTGRYGGQNFKPTVLKLTLWESKELLRGLDDLRKEINATIQQDITLEIPRLRHHNSKCTDMQLDAYWDAFFTTVLSSGNLQFRPVRHSDGKMTVKFFSKRANLGIFPSGGISMSIGSELIQYLIAGLQQLQTQIQNIERKKLNITSHTPSV